MKKYIRFLGLPICLSLSFCSSKGSKNCTFTVFNNAPTVLDSVVISGYSPRETIINIKPGEKRQGTVSIADTGRYRGGFVCLIYAKDSLKNQTSFGYFANPSEIKSAYNIKVSDQYAISE